MENKTELVEETIILDQEIDDISYMGFTSKVETFDPFDLVKIDTQGAELDILNGGSKTIKHSKYLLLEVSTMQYNIGAPLMDQVVSKLKEYEFVIEDILDYHKLSNGSIFQLDILFKNSYI
jgi:hypothetical protein